MEITLTQNIAKSEVVSDTGATVAHFPKILNGTSKNIMLIRIWLSVSAFILKKYPNPIHFTKIIRNVIDLRNRFTIDNTYTKLAYVDGRVFFNHNNNGWPAKHFNRLIDVEAKGVVYNNVSNLENLRMVLIALTKKCPLNCEHCLEGPELNKKDTLSIDDHKKILKKLQSVGVSMIHYSGGDPMTKVNELVELFETAEKTTDFWIYTSGYNFTVANAARLKKAGLTGVVISLDHHDPEKHNAFRRNASAFKWASDAAENAMKSKLVITLSICVTREFCSEENLLKYLQLAKTMGASFVQLLEPRAVGNYAGMDVALNSEQYKIVEDFFLATNREQKYKDFPIVLFQGYHQRKMGCAGAGSKYLYIDTDGYMSSCPFCRNQKSHILDDEHESSIAEMKNDGCGMFSSLN